MIDRTCFAPEKYIQDPESGSVAVCISIIECAFDDVRRYLAPPTACTSQEASQSHKAQIQARAVITVRRTRAIQAASFLQSDACQELVSILAACGLRVPMRKIFRELQTLKNSAS